MRNLIFITILLSFVSCKDDSEEKYYQMKSDFNAALEEMWKNYQNATTQEEKIAAFEKVDVQAYTKKIYDLVNANRNSNYAVDAWCELFNKTQSMNDSIFEYTIDELMNKHIKSDQLNSISFGSLSKSSNPKTEKFILKVIEVNPNKAIKGAYTLALAKKYTEDKDSDMYDLEKGLELFRILKKEYGSVEIDDAGELKKLETIAEDALSGITRISVGNKMPEVVSTDLKGNKVKLSDYLEKVVVLDVWATWCAPCIQMIPHQTVLTERLKDQPFQLISISIDKKIATVNKFLEKTKMPWVHWHNGDKGGVIDDWAITGYPTIIIVDKKGIIRHRSNGSINSEEIDSIVNNLLNTE